MKMAKIKMKTAELEGAALDWAVAKCLGLFKGPSSKRLDPKAFLSARWAGNYRYSTNWDQGGAVILLMMSYCQERDGDNCYCSTPSVAKGWHDHPVRAHGPTPLIAGMRCFVVSRVGSEIEIPEEIL